MIRALKGMKDTLSPQNKKFEYFIENSTKIVKKYGYELIETPILEETALFKRSVGESSDIVGKEMYQFTDKGGNDVCLRPEGTAGIVRAFVEAKMDRAGGLHRYFYYGPMFRYERPQKGRFRQFHQFGCESFGEANPQEDATIILMIKEILDFFNITYTLELNSLGCPECLPPFREKLISYLEQNDGFCEDCQRRKETNPIRVFDCKNSHCQMLLEEAPRLNHALCQTCQDDFSVLLSSLDAHHISYELNPNLVRGLDYYSKTAFEFVSSALGAQNAVAGGGRYDRLVEFLDGRPTPAIGFAIGIERILDMITLDNEAREGYYFGALCKEASPALFKAATSQRESDKVIHNYDIKSLKAHLKGADKAHARYCAVIGEDELKNSLLWVKDLVEKSEELRPLS
jgi:histidyl-tRNA synthetase